MGDDNNDSDNGGKYVNINVLDPSVTVRDDDASHKELKDTAEDLLDKASKKHKEIAELEDEDTGFQ